MADGAQIIEQADSSLVNEVRAAVNIGPRVGLPDGQTGPDILLLHYTGMGSAEGALKWLCCEESKVSCHYFIFEDGRIVQSVREADRAQHAGEGAWEGHRDINSRSIGIEIANVGHAGGLPDFPQQQMDAVLALSKDIIARNNILPHRVIGHSDMAPHRKEDPGEKFRWDWLAAHGVGHFVDPFPLESGSFFQLGDQGEPVEALQSMLALYGYDLEITAAFDARTEIVVTAFQRHFRQSKVDGVADLSTIKTLHGLLAALPVPA
ncbi:MAG: N-acetylmuramoyl-L-alanine amidase [Pseudomonadota bacterium]